MLEEFEGLINFVRQPDMNQIVNIIEHSGKTLVFHNVADGIRAPLEENASVSVSKSKRSIEIIVIVVEA